jgi:hypothetical protein
MSKATIFVLALLVLAAGGVALFHPVKLGGQLLETDKQQFSNGLWAGDDKQVQFTREGDLVWNTTGFCIDFYATSTATRTKMVASTTATVEGTDGVMIFQYGSCQ